MYTDFFRFIVIEKSESELRYFNHFIYDIVQLFDSLIASTLYYNKLHIEIIIHISLGCRNAALFVKNAQRRWFSGRPNAEINI